MAQAKLQAFRNFTGKSCLQKSCWFMYHKAMELDFIHYVGLNPSLTFPSQRM